ncbi:MAG: DinB family protein [Flavobacteriaceae bacterium]
MKPAYSFTLLFFVSSFAMAQALPFSQIPEAPKQLTPSATLLRMVQGLGFRYYWATEGLRKKDLDYRPSRDASSSLETLQHLYGLSKTIAEAVQNIPSKRPDTKAPVTLESLRAETLTFLEQATQLLSQADQESLENMKIVFDREGKQSAFPLWNLINGPISDALYHTGQVVSFRRTSGNPIAKGVNVFLGIKN